MFGNPQYKGWEVFLDILKMLSVSITAVMGILTGGWFIGQTLEIYLGTPEWSSTAGIVLSIVGFAAAGIYVLYKEPTDIPGG